MKTIILRTVIGVLFFIGSHQNATAFNHQGANNPEKELFKKDNTTKIQVALLLDTSSSMDGLIEQTKSRLWNIVNTLTTLKYNGKAPQIEIALYEYGNSGISEKLYPKSSSVNTGSGFDLGKIIFFKNQRRTEILRSSHKFCYRAT